MENALATKQNLIRRMYDWILHWAKTPYGTPALFILAFTESSFFPIPPDVLLIALCLSIPTRSFYYALICSIGSVLGGAFGYLIGLTFMDTIGMKILSIYGFQGQYQYVQQLYMKYDAWAVGIAGFTPIPYKVFTISAGAFKISFNVFMIASIISRSLRFFLVAGLIYIFGNPIKIFIDKYFNLLTIIFTLLLIGGFVIIKYFF
ncbi:MAG TPA: YqaA family protein [Syntrophorhabdaceae bacterium]|nr:YqaA family protein [Syntrophorhabdaceae bacterium]HPU29656.1 YqaA family protein [Syntrophorhabdaceae bacterium]